MRYRICLLYAKTYDLIHDDGSKKKSARPNFETSSKDTFSDSARTCIQQTQSGCRRWCTQRRRRFSPHVDKQQERE